jgi:hypothetical protein
VTSNVDETKMLIEAEFEYVCDHNETMMFRKRKWKCARWTRPFMQLIEAANL